MKTLLILLLSFVTVSCIAQIYEPGRLYVRVKRTDAIPTVSGAGTSKSIVFANGELQTIFSPYSLQDFKRAFIQTNNEDLNNTYEVNCNCDEAQLMNRLLTSATTYYSLVERIPTIIPTYTPNDYGAPGARTDLNLIKALEAWDITQGNSNIKIAIVECCNGFDISHQDLQNQIVYIEPGVVTNNSGGHGNAAAGAAAAATNNGVGISSIGFNCKLMLYTGGYNEILDAAQRGAKIINCSWGSLTYSATNNTLLQTVNSMGATVVAGAGNGVCWERKFCPPGAPTDCDPCTTPTACDGGTVGCGCCRIYPASYDNVISVTSVGHINNIGYVDPVYGANNWKDVHPQIITDPQSGHNHNDKIDICAPGYNITTTGDNNTYIGAWGTSFAAPMVAGVCGLILSVNPCLRPIDVETILKSTAVNIDNITENQPFAGLLGAGRVNAHQAVLLAQTYGTVVSPITANTTWTTDNFIKGNVTIEAGATLTINSAARIFFESGAKIIVKQNAKLILDNAVLTSNCVWGGVEVWGNASQHQYVYGSNQLYQGYVELKNGAMIENANTAISLGKNGDWQMLNTGGIVKASGNSVFRNNKRDIEFLKYQNFNPANPAQKRANLSSFRNCRFETTANLKDGSSPTHHVTMWNVDGVNFYGCTFENINPNATSSTNLGNGIYTEDANFVVSGCDLTVACLPGICCNYAPNVFRNLNYGIWTKRVSGISYNYNVDRCDFINCLFGVNNEGVDNAIITRNNLTVGKPRFASWWTTGINFNAGSGYRIEENVITRDPAPNSTSIGTWLTTTGMNNNQVYKNSFTNVSIGNYAYQRNRGYDASTGLYSGLAYLCNTHTTIGTNDIYIYGNDPVNDGIRQYQGKLNTTNTNAINSAGNTFTRSGVNSESDIANPNTPNITYFYDGSALLSNIKYPSFVTTNRVTRAPLTANTCPSAFSSGGSGKNSETVELGINNGELSEDIKHQVLLDYQTYDQALNQYKSLYAALVDGGNTPQLKETVENSWPTETWQLRQNLLGKSPYLSKEVLKESSDKTNVLPDAVIFEILAANPDGLKDEELLKHLSEKVNPLPAWMIELLREGTGQTTPRTFLEAAISNTKAQRDLAITYLVHDMLSKRGDNQEINHSQLRSWLAAYQTPNGDYQIVDDYFETGDYNAGLAILSTVPVIYKLNEKEQLEFNGLRSLLNVLAGVNTSGRNIFALDESERNTIQDLADNGEGIAKVRACNILGFVYGTECDYGLMLPDGRQSYKADKAPVGKDNPLLPSINVFPNPAKDYVEFSYTLPSGAQEGTLTIVDLKGVVIHKQQLSNKYGQIAIETRDWQQGTYLYTLSANGNAVANQKFVLIK